MHSRLMRYRGRSNSKENGRGSNARGGEWEREQEGWWVKGDEETETPNGMQLMLIFAVRRCRANNSV